MLSKLWRDIGSSSMDGLRAQFSPTRLFPDSASSLAPHTDALFWTLVVICSLVGLGIAFFLIFFIIRYRVGSKANRENPPPTLLSLELAWMLIPLFIFIVIFLWSAGLYFFIQRPPTTNVLQIYVMGKQWMWKFQHPGGQREINELHIPVNRTVRVLLTSQDVIHSLFIPAFRIKQDALPGRYTTAWFKATKTGQYHLFCTEYCGLNHSRMGGWVYVMRAEDYDQWLQTRKPETSMVAAGLNHFVRLGCSGCHYSGGRDGPVLNGLFGRQVALQNGQTRTADYQYIRDSILLPQQDVVAGYPPNMPTFAGIIREQELLEIIEYIKSLSSIEVFANEQPY